MFRLRERFTRTYEQRDRALALYTPLSLVCLPAVWLAAVLLGYTAIFWSLGSHPLRQDFITSGSSLLTLGFAAVEMLERFHLLSHLDLLETDVWRPRWPPGRPTALAPGPRSARQWAAAGLGRTA